MALGSDLPSPDLGMIRELKQWPQWICWKNIKNDRGKVRKQPIDPKTARNASVTDPSTWGTFEEAYQFALSTDANGIGFVLTGIEQVTVIDLDHVADPETGELEPWARDVIEEFNTFTELSPSLTGVHLWCHGRPPGKRCRNKHIEMYAEKRYMTVTGKMIELAQTDEIEKRQDKINELYEEEFNTTPVHGAIPQATPREEEEHDPDGLPYPASNTWEFEQALYFCQKIMQDGRPEPPHAKLLALTTNDSRFSKIWTKSDVQSQDSCGNDQSAWDLSLANRLFMAEGLTWRDILGILIKFRSQYTEDKLDRPDYWARTLARASDNVIKRRQDREEKKRSEQDYTEVASIAEEFHQAVQEGDELGKKDGLFRICDKIGCPAIIRITRINRPGEPLFTIHFGKNSSDKISGEIALLTNCVKFRNAIASKMLRFVKPMTDKKWNSIVPVLLASVEDEEVIEDADTDLRTREMLEAYLISQPRPIEFGPDSYTLDGPWHHRHKILMRLSHLEAFLRKQKINIDRSELVSRLRAINVERKTIGMRLGKTTGTSVSLYVIPDEYGFYAMANNEPDDLELIDDEEKSEGEDRDPQNT